MIRQRHDSIERHYKRGGYDEESSRIVFYGREFIQSCDCDDMEKLIKYAESQGLHLLIDAEFVGQICTRIKKLEDVVNSIVKSWPTSLAEPKPTTSIATAMLPE